MALLSIDKRKEYFKTLGLGEYNEENIRKMQSRYMMRSSDVDGIYGDNSDNLLRHLYNCHLYLKPDNFKPEEFRCGCNGRYCCGYPSYMKPAELMNIQSIRTHFGKPMTITCGVRCTRYNTEVGGIPNSEHKVGLAVDYYIAGVTDTPANRQASMEWVKDLPNHHYTYGNGRYIETANGRVARGYVSAPGMGNAMHTDSYDGTPGPAPEPTPAGKLTVDGIIGTASVRRAQAVFGTLQDGNISGQRKDLIQVYFPSLIAVTYNGVKSTLVMAIQKWAGCTADSVWGKDTSAAVQRKLLAEGYNVGPWGADGIFGKSSAAAFQKWLNDHDTPTPPEKKGYLMIDVSEFQRQIDWSKVKASGVKAAMIRVAGRGGERGNIYDDVRFAENIKNAHAAGLPVGIYFLTQAINAAEGREEAAYAIRKWTESGIPISYTIGIDSENVEWTNEDGTKGYGRANDRNLSKAKRTEAIKAFADECKRQGYESMIYASTSWLYNQVDMSILAPLMSVWCAQWAPSCDYTGKYIIWQYSNSGKVSGITGNTDMNMCYVEGKKVNPPAPAPTPDKKPYGGDYPTAADIRRSQIGGLCRACREQSAWSYGSEFDFEENPTIPKSKYKSTCVTYVSCVMQRIKVFASGECLWHDGRGYGDGKVRGANGQMTVTYHDNKPLSEVSLQTGDVVFYDDNKSGEMGNGGHEEIFNGTRNGTHSFFYSGGTGSYHNTSNNNSEPNTRKVLATVRLKPRTYLQFGDDGEGVKKLQKYMLWFGLDLGKWGADGIFGEATEKAVGAMQEALGVKVDYLVGQDTLKAMKAYRK